MCMRKCILNIGGKIFNILVLLSFIAGIASAVEAGIMVGGKQGIIAALLQLIMFWGSTLIVSLVVYSLLDIRQSLCCNKEEQCQRKSCDDQNQLN